jgi:hypothetical protein
MSWHSTPALLAAFGKEGLNDRRAFRSKNCRGDLHLMVEARIRKHLKAATHRPALGVISAVDQAWDASLNNRAGTHAARLDGDIESGACKAVVAQLARRFAKDDDFGVSRGIVIADGAVAGAGNDLAIVHQNRAYGNLAGFRAGTGFRKSFLHAPDISFHVRRENNMWEERKRIQTPRHKSTEVQ